MKRLSLFALSSVVAFMVSCSGNSGSGEQQQESAESESSSQEEAVSPELAKKIELGKQLYTQNCLACHQENGAGVTNAFPPLIQTEWTQGENTKLIAVLINGLQGKLEVKGVEYNGAMPTQAHLSNDDIANILTYVKNSFDNGGGEVTSEEVESVRQTAGASN